MEFFTTFLRKTAKQIHKNVAKTSYRGEIQIFNLPEAIVRMKLEYMHLRKPFKKSRKGKDFA